MALLLTAFLVMLMPATATAATIVNGDFESGTLNGWHLRRTTQAGNWFAYKGTAAPIGSKRNPPADPVQAPPQGTYAAIADEANPDTLILYQDVALEAGSSQRLGLLAYYNSYKPIAVPTPDTLSVDEEALGGQHNQQFRIDVMKPSAPIESLDPTDILRTVFKTELGSPQKLLPTRMTADLTPFAGQKVRLRIANAVHEEVFNAGVDAVSITGGSGSPSHDSGRLTLGKAKANGKNGTVTLSVHAPGKGQLTVKGQGIPPSARLGRAGKLRKTIKPAAVRVAAAGTVKIHLRPTPFALAVLKREHKLRVKVTVTFIPSDGLRERASARVVFKLGDRGN